MYDHLVGPHSKCIVYFVYRIDLCVTNMNFLVLLELRESILSSVYHLNNSIVDLALYTEWISPMKGW